MGVLAGLALTRITELPGAGADEVEAVVARLDTPTRSPQDVALHPELVVRGTTAPPRA